MNNNYDKRTFEHKLYNYNQYTFNKIEYIKYVVIAFFLILIAGYLFFKNIYIMVFLCGFSFLCPKILRKSKIKKQKNELTLQFKDSLMCISSSLSAGRSLHMAFIDVPDELKIIYPDKNTFINKEFENIRIKLNLNQSLETIFDDFSSRSKIEPIENFSEILKTCNTSGGNLNEAIKNTASVIIEKIEIQNEIDILTSEQRLTLKILICIPFIIIYLIGSTSKDYITPLYSPIGNLLMLAVSLLIILSFYIGKKIIEIEV